MSVQIITSLRLLAKRGNVSNFLTFDIVTNEKRKQNLRNRQKLYRLESQHH